MAIQYFSLQYLEHAKQLTPEQVLQFLEDFRLLNQQTGPSKLISLKVPEPLLSAFRQRCEIAGVRYQTQIKRLMSEWLAK